MRMMRGKRQRVNTVSTRTRTTQKMVNEEEVLGQLHQSMAKHIAQRCLLRILNVLIQTTKSETTSIKTLNEARYGIHREFTSIYLRNPFYQLFHGNSLTTKTFFYIHSFRTYDHYITFDENENDPAPSLTTTLVGSYFRASLGCDGLLKRYVIKIANR